MPTSVPRALVQLAERQEIRYLAVAGTTTLVYLGLLAGFLATGIHYMLAIGAAQVLIICTAFWAYRGLVFRSTGPVLRDFTRFLGVWSSGAVAGVVATPLLVELTPVPPFPAQVVAIIVVAFGSYLGHHFLSFADKSVPASPRPPEAQ